MNENNKRNALPIGTKIQSGKREYTIEQVLGAGGFGITYKASAIVSFGKIRQRVTFAIKEFFMGDYCERQPTDSSMIYSNPSKNKVEESKKNFNSEVKRLSTLDNENIIKIDELFEANNTVYYVMEYIDGLSLRNYVKANGALREAEALQMIVPIAKALVYLHKLQVTHLDIKPDNIMLKEEENGYIVPILIDFGLSKHYEKDGQPTSTISITGCSEGYSPMEQYLGITSFTPQADIYALAATLYYLLVGKDPANASFISPDKISDELPTNISDNVRTAILNAMKKDRDYRTPLVTQFLATLNVFPETTEKYDNKTEIKSSDKKQKLSIDIDKKKLQRFAIIGGSAFVLAILIIFLWDKIGNNIPATNTHKSIEAEIHVDSILSVISYNAENAQDSHILLIDLKHQMNDIVAKDINAAKSDTFINVERRINNKLNMLFNKFKAQGNNAANSLETRIDAYKSALKIKSDAVIANNIDKLESQKNKIQTTPNVETPTNPVATESPNNYNKKDSNKEIIFTEDDFTN